MLPFTISFLLSAPSNCQLCQSDGYSCSTSTGWINNSLHCPTDILSLRFFFSLKNFILLRLLFAWSCGRRELSNMKVAVAADYSDSFPDSSSYTSARGYHPLEEVKVAKMMRQPQLTSAEIARTTVEANSTALLMFPGTVHCEPHEEMSWSEFQYVVDDYGDIYIEIFDGRNILQDPEASNPVNAFIGMDVPVYENKRVANEYTLFNIGGGNNIPFDEDFFQVMDSEVSDIPVDWGMPDTCSWIHPLYFAKCLTKAIDMEHDRNLVHPSNGVSIVGCIRPAFDDEESYFRSVIHSEDSDGYNSDSEDGDILNLSSKRDVLGPRSTVYRLEIIGIELFSVYGSQAAVGLLDFQDAEPDVLLNSISTIVERFNDRGINCDVALKALCKKRGLDIEEAHLIGVDSLGLDVRVTSGVEVKTHRFPFKARARSEISAEKQINQLLFPRSRRKRRNNGLREPRSDY
ncbi:Uncharacterized protein At3g49140 [Linum perenne]